MLVGKSKKQRKPFVHVFLCFLNIGKKYYAYCTESGVAFCEVCAHLKVERCYYNMRKPPNTLYSFCYTP